MTLSAPYSQYSPSFAKKTRFVYVSGAATPYLVCLVLEAGVQRFAYKPVDTSSFTVTFVPVAVGNVSSFGVMETSDPWHVAFLYADSGRLKYMVVDFQDNNILVAPTYVTEGSAPALAKFGATLMQIYIREQRLFGREVGGVEGLLNDSSAYSVTDQDVIQKAATSRVRYAGTQIEQAELALSLGLDADTILLWHCWKAEEIDYAEYAYDTFGGLYNLNRSNLVRTDNVGQVDRCFRFPVYDQGSLSRTLSAAVISRSASVSLWQYGGADLPGSVDSYLVSIDTATGSIANIRFPTSGGLLAYHAGGDAITKALSSGDYQGAWSHWLFQKATHDDMVIRRGPPTGSMDEYYLRIECYARHGLHVGMSITIENAPPGSYGGTATILEIVDEYVFVLDGIYSEFWGDQDADWTANIMEVWRNGVLWNSDTGKTGAFEATIVRVRMAFWWQGLLDDVAFMNHFHSPAEVAAIYARGLAGLPLSTSDTPGLYRYWKMDAPDTKVGIRDQVAESGYFGGAHLFTENLQPVVDLGIQFSTYSPLPFLWTVPASLTVEAKFVARRGNYLNYLLDGNMWLTYDFDGLLRFGFVDANGKRHEFIEVVRAGSHVLPDEINHLALVHKWGDRASTKFIINGTEVVGKWRSEIPYTTGASGAIATFADYGGEYILVTTTLPHGRANGDVVQITGTVNYDGIYIVSNVLASSFTIIHAWAGNDAMGSWTTSNVDHELAGGIDPQFTNKPMSSTVFLGDGDILVGMKFSKVLRTPTQMRNYVRGRSA